MIFLFLFSVFAQNTEAPWPATEFLRDQVAKIPRTTRVIVLSDEAHRGPNTRALTLQIMQEFAARYPREKVCLTLETTPKVDEAYDRFTKDGDYAKHFGPLAEKLHAAAPELTPADAQRIFIEPSETMARGLSGVRVFGVDVDYTDAGVFKPLYENMRPPRKIPDDEFAVLFIKARNEAMANRANALLKSGTCTRLVMSMGSAHVRAFQGPNDTFPDYTGGPIAGVAGRLEAAFAGKPFVIGLLSTKERQCPQDCALTTVVTKLNDLNVVAPSNYFEVGWRSKVSGDGFSGATVSK